MARHALFRALALAAALICIAPAHARAETLQHLRVTALTLSADTGSPRIEVPFHLIVLAHVREHVTELDNVDLPILAELELLGDEHTLIADTGGTTYRETITVVAHHGGTITIAPVTLDAIDARDGIAKRFSSNSLTLHVLGPLAAPVELPSSGGRIAWVPVLVAFAATFALWLAVVARRRRPAPVPVPRVTLPPPVPVAPRDPRERVRAWLGQLRSQPTRGGAMLVRAEVRRSVGASETETLADVLQRPLARDPATARLLRALERAGFTYDSDVQAAIAAALAQLEEMAR